MRGIKNEYVHGTTKSEAVRNMYRGKQMRIGAKLPSDIMIGVIILRAIRKWK